MAAFAVCALLCIIYLGYYGHPLDRVIVASILAGFVGALAELIPIAKLDDNLTLPVMSASGLALLFYFFGFFSNVG
ncbi:hypothetical protein D3C72_1867680 [compost metagenome]